MKLPLALAASSLFAVDALSAGNPRCNQPDPEPPRERDPVPPREDIPWCMWEDGRNCWHR